MDLLCRTVFFRPKTISKVAIIKTKGATIAFFSSSFPSPRSFFFCFPFPSLIWFWSFSGLRNMPFDAFSLKWLQISLGWFSKNRLDIYTPKGAHDLEPLCPLISWVNPFQSRFINRTPFFLREVSYFRESRMSPWTMQVFCMWSYLWNNEQILPYLYWGSNYVGWIWLHSFYFSAHEHLCQT